MSRGGSHAERAPRSAVEDDPYLRDPAGGDLGAGNRPGDGQRFEELKTADDGWVVQVRPEQVVEIAFDGLQRSSRYPGGVALRFARVVRYRDDKSAADADTIQTVRGLARWE